MSAQPAGSSELPYEVIHLGGHAAVVVPLADFMRLRALEQLATAQEHWRTPRTLRVAGLESTRRSGADLLRAR